MLDVLQGIATHDVDTSQSNCSTVSAEATEKISEWRTTESAKGHSVQFGAYTTVSDMPREEGQSWQRKTRVREVRGEGEGERRLGGDAHRY